MTNLRQNFTIPPSRLVWGSMTEAQQKDAEGKPLVIKNGPDAGKPTQRFAFGVAVPKAPGQTHWGQQPASWNEAADGKYWGAQLWAVGHAAFPNGQAQRPDFAWKVIDGDSSVPNKKGRKPCDQTGYKGNWILAFSSSFAPRTFNAQGSAPIPPESIKCGYYVQVAGTVDGNMSDNQPGIYLNHNLVALAAYGEEIVNGPDATAVGFGKGALPAGASAVPVGGLPTAGLPPAPGAGIPAATPAAPSVSVPVALPTALPPPPSAVAPAAAQTAVVPNHSFLNAGVPAAPGAPPAPVPAPPPAGPQMTAKAGTTTYAAFIQNNWTDATLREHGYMV